MWNDELQKRRHSQNIGNTLGFKAAVNRRTPDASRCRKSFFQFRGCSNPKRLPPSPRLLRRDKRARSLGLTAYVPAGRNIFLSPFPKRFECSSLPPFFIYDIRLTIDVATWLPRTNADAMRDLRNKYINMKMLAWWVLNHNSVRMRGIGNIYAYFAGVPASPDCQVAAQKFYNLFCLRKFAAGWI
jgi:hypothetical protein